MLCRKNILDLIHVGAIIKMDAGYYTKSPYYIEVLEVTPDKIVTNIPGEHKLEMKGSTLEHHLKRMTYIGHKDRYGYLIQNQKLI